MMSIQFRARLALQVLLSALVFLVVWSAAAPALAWGGKTVVGSGVQVEDVRLVAGYNKIEVKGAMDVELRQSGKEGVIIIADDNIAPLIRAQVQGKTLVLDSNASWSTKIKMRVIIDVTTLSGVSVSGAGDVRASSLKTGEITIVISGSGDINLENLAADSLTVRVSGSGDFRASGTAKAQSYSIAGSGDIRAEGLEGSNVKVNIAGSGDARVWAKEALDAVIMGSGDIRYKGKPNNVNKRVLGSGDVSAI